MKKMHQKPNPWAEVGMMVKAQRLVDVLSSKVYLLIIHNHRRCGHHHPHSHLEIQNWLIVMRDEREKMEWNTKRENTLHVYLIHWTQKRYTTNPKASLNQHIFYIFHLVSFNLSIFQSYIPSISSSDQNREGLSMFISERGRYGYES